MAPDVSLEECSRLARAMTRKNAAAGLPHGGGKSVIFADPRCRRRARNAYPRLRLRHRGVEDYIVGPDMGTDEISMAWIKDEIGRSVGLPREMGGIPLDEIGATGFGLAASIEVAQEFCDLKIAGARVAVQGSARSAGMRRVSWRRRARCWSRPRTLKAPRRPERPRRCRAHRREAGRGVAGIRQGKGVDRDAIIDAACDIWIPAARPDVLRADNVSRLRTKLVAQGANIPATAEAERRCMSAASSSFPTSSPTPAA